MVFYSFLIGNMTSSAGFYRLFDGFWGYHINKEVTLWLLGVDDRLLEDVGGFTDCTFQSWEIPAIRRDLDATIRNFNDFGLQSELITCEIWVLVHFLCSFSCLFYPVVLFISSESFCFLPSPV